MIRRFLEAIVLAFLTVSLASCGGSGGGSGGTLTVLGMDVQGQTDVPRNSPIVVRFSSNVAPRSVSLFGFQVEDENGNLFPGRIVVSGNTIVFYPTFFNGTDGQGIDQSINDYTPSNNPPENGTGFDSGTGYTVKVLGGSPLGPQTVAGRPVVQTFFGTFRVGGGFAEEVNPVPPMLAEPPTFSQVPTNDSCFPDSVFGDPAVGCPPSSSDLIPVPSFDPSEIRVTVTFTEPMDPATFSPASTMTLSNTTQSIPVMVFGSVSPSDDLRSYTFSPLSSLGDDPLTSDPFQFELLLSNTVTDLSGNPLAGNPPVDGSSSVNLESPLTFRFSTIDKPGEPNFEFFVEDFESQTNRRGQAAGIGTDPEIWLGTGSLEGRGVRFREVEVPQPMPNRNLAIPQPLVPGGSRTQILLERTIFNDSGFGTPESIVGASWGPQSNFIAGSTYPQVTMSLGHTTRESVNGGLKTNFAENLTGFSNNPTQVFRGSYPLETSLNRAFVEWPEFRTDFEYDGQSNVLFDIDVIPGGETFHLFRHDFTACTPRLRVAGPSGSDSGSLPGTCGSGDNASYHQRFTVARKISFAVSREIDTGSDAPDYTSVVVIADGTRLGAEFELKFTGNPGIGFPPRPDLMSTVGPVDDINLLDGLRFFSFSFDLKANPFTGVRPAIDSIVVGYRTN